MTQDFACACRTCASNRNGACTRGGVVIGGGRAECASFARQGTDAEFSSELSPRMPHILCGYRACIHNDAMRCLAEKTQIADGLCVSRHDLRF